MRSDAEVTVRRVLAGLRDAEVPGGMERRVLEAVRERAAAPRRPWAWPLTYAAHRSLVRVAAAGGVFAGVVVICLGLLVVHREEQLPSHATVPQAAFGLRAPVSRASVTPPLRARTVGVKKRSEVPPDRAARAEDAGELDAAWVPSFPAPPMPLTEQERLLVRLAHKGDPVELAMLDPMLREARNAEEKAEFERFFERPVTGDSK